MDDNALRDHVVELLKGGHAHATFDDAAGRIDPSHRGDKANGAPHTAWQLLEHIRIAQSDILEFIRDPKYQPPPWPAGYWPSTEAPPEPDSWDETSRRYRQDLAALIELVNDRNSDLLKPIAHGDGQTILREALMTADHTSYHLGQLLFLEKQLIAEK